MTEHPEINAGGTTEDQQIAGESSDELNKKEIQIQKEKKDLLDRLVSGQIENIRDRVAFILNYSVRARNSDIDLAWSYWQTFESDKISGKNISNEQMKEVARIPSLTRIRAKIQNDYKLFQADDKVKRFRGKLAEDKKNEALEDRPTDIGLYSVYIDETGKTQEFLSVGSLWILKYDVPTVMEFQKWRKEHGIDFELHFAELSKHKIELYKEFFIKFLSMFPESGFKLIVVNSAGLNDKTKAIVDLTYHLIVKGVEHENVSGRAPLPRMLDVCLDQEEKGSDQLKIENIKERLTSRGLKQLYINDITAIPSSQDLFLQVTDLFAGSINRKLHFPGLNNVKDEFADFVLGTLKFDLSKVNKQNSSIDNSTVFNLANMST